MCRICLASRVLHAFCCLCIYLATGVLCSFDSECEAHFWLPARGAACSNSRPRPGAKTFGGLEGGGEGG